MPSFRVLVAGALLPIFVAFPASAAPEVKVGLVDLQKALAASDAGQSAQKKYEVEVTKVKGKVEQQKKELDSLKESYRKQQSSLNENARRTKEEEIISREKDLKRNLQDSQDTLRRQNAELVTDLVKRIRSVVDQVGHDQGFTVILEKGSQSVLYADNTIDITDTVIEKFNKSK